MMRSGLMDVVSGTRPSSMRRTTSLHSAGVVRSLTYLLNLVLMALAAAKSSHSAFSPS